MAADCGCSGIRSCLMCETTEEAKCIKMNQENDKDNVESFLFCLRCQRSFSGGSCSHSVSKQSMENKFVGLDGHGVIVIENFITKDEEDFIITEIEKFPWRISQSGRRKQDFGPKANFKKRKVKTGRFSGLPSFSQFFVNRLHQDVPQLANFHPVELCNLDYSPERGASIDPHVDDSWLWGEHLVTLNLLSDTILTLTHLDRKYKVKIPLPRYSLVILKGESRYEFMHGIKRSDIHARRIAVTLRELSEEFVSGNGYKEIGSTLLELATTFHGLPST